MPNREYLRGLESCWFESGNLFSLMRCRRSGAFQSEMGK
jgi:hypothetical protein